MTSDWAWLPTFYMNAENTFTDFCNLLCNIKLTSSSDRRLMIYSVMFLPNAADLYSLGLYDIMSSLPIRLLLLKPEQELKSWYSD
jgi:hypothetical protein